MKLRYFVLGCIFAVPLALGYAYLRRRAFRGFR